MTGPYTPTINLLPTDDPGGVDVPPDHLCDESLPPELAILASAFPFAKAAGIAGLRDAMRALAPSYNDAVRLAESFFAYASWLGSPCNKERFMVEVLMPLYASKSWELEQPDQLALFFGIESVGAMFDQNRPHYDPLAFRLHKLCAVSLALSKPLDKPTLTSLEAMVCCCSTIYLYMLTLYSNRISFSINFLVRNRSNNCVPLNLL